MKKLAIHIVDSITAVLFLSSFALFLTLAKLAIIDADSMERGEDHT